MGKRGPARTPTKIREKRGTLRADRIPTEEAIVEYLPGLPEPPIRLNKDERKFWDHITGHVFAMGFLSSADFPMMVRYALESSLYHKAIKDVKRNGVSIATEKGFIKNQNYAVVKDLGANLRIMEREFGLTPSARASLDISKIKNGGSGDATPGPSPKPQNNFQL